MKYDRRGSPRASSRDAKEREGSCCAAFAWLPLLTLVVLVIIIPFWHIYINQAQDTLRAILAALGTDASSLPKLFYWFDVARLISIICLATAGAVALVLFFAETANNFGRSSAGGPSSGSLSVLIGLEALASALLWLLLLVVIALLAGCVAWYACAYLGTILIAQTQSTSNEVQGAVAKGSAAADRFMDQLQGAAKEALRARAPSDVQQAGWWSAAMAGLDAFVKEERQKLAPSRTCPSSCTSFGPLAALANLQDPCLCLVDRYAVVSTLLGTLQQQLIPALIAISAALVAISWLLVHAPVQLVQARYELAQVQRYNQEAQLMQSGGAVDPSVLLQPGAYDPYAYDFTNRPAAALQHAGEVAGARPLASYQSSEWVAEPPAPSAPPAQYGTRASSSAAAAAGVVPPGPPPLPVGAAAPVMPPRRGVVADPQQDVEMAAANQASSSWAAGSRQQQQVAGSSSGRRFGTSHY